MTALALVADPRPDRLVLVPVRGFSPHIAHSSDPTVLPSQRSSSSSSSSSSRRGSWPSPSPSPPRPLTPRPRPSSLATRLRNLRSLARPFTRKAPAPSSCRHPPPLVLASPSELGVQNQQSPAGSLSLCPRLIALAFLCTL